MAQGSRFVAPRFNGPGLWDPRVPGVAYPEPKEGVPYVQGTDGLSGDCGCSGMGKTLPVDGAAQIAQLSKRVNLANVKPPMSTKTKVAIVAGIGVAVVLGVALLGKK